MTRFTPDNTDGYSKADLACLNASFEMRLHDLRDRGIDVDADDIGTRSLLNHVAAEVQAAYDAVSPGTIIALSRIWS